MQPIHDATTSVVMHASLANVDSVMVAGRWRNSGAAVCLAGIRESLKVGFRHHDGAEVAQVDAVGSKWVASAETPEGGESEPKQTRASASGGVRWGAGFAATRAAASRRRGRAVRHAARGRGGAVPRLAETLSVCRPARLASSCDILDRWRQRIVRDRANLALLKGEETENGWRRARRIARFYVDQTV